MCDITATPIIILDFSFVFSAACLKKPVFNKWDLLRWKVPARLY
jgi:hypothetical protein